MTVLTFSTRSQILMPMESIGKLLGALLTLYVLFLSIWAVLFFVVLCPIRNLCHSFSLPHISDFVNWSVVVWNASWNLFKWYFTLPTYLLTCSENSGKWIPYMNLLWLPYFYNCWLAFPVSPRSTGIGLSIAIVWGFSLGYSLDEVADHSPPPLCFYLPSSLMN